MLKHVDACVLLEPTDRSQSDPVFVSEAMMNFLCKSEPSDGSQIGE